MELQSNSLHVNAKKLKEDGSGHFKNKNYQHALSAYISAIEAYDTLLNDCKDTELHLNYNKEKQNTPVCNTFGIL